MCGRDVVTQYSSILALYGTHILSSIPDIDTMYQQRGTGIHRSSNHGIRYVSLINGSE